MLALIMNPARQHRPGQMSPAQWALLATAIAMLLLTLLYREPAFRETSRYSIQGLALMPIFYFAVRFSGNPLPFRYLNTSLVITLGAYSYTIYLIHYVVIRLIDKNVPAIGTRPYLLFPAALLISIAYAAAIERFVEPYFKRLRRKFRPGSQKRPPLPSDTSRSVSIFYSAASQFPAVEPVDFSQSGQPASKPAAGSP